MKHLIALLIKYIMVVAILSVTLGLMTELTFGQILYISTAVTVLTYVLGDLLVLSASNRIVAAIADFIISLAAVYLYNELINVKLISGWNAILSALILSIGEWFYHIYVVRRLLDDHV